MSQEKLYNFWLTENQKKSLLEKEKRFSLGDNFHIRFSTKFLLSKFPIFEVYINYKGCSKLRQLVRSKDDRYSFYAVEGTIILEDIINFEKYYHETIDNFYHYLKIDEEIISLENEYEKVFSQKYDQDYYRFPYWLEVKDGNYSYGSYCYAKNKENLEPGDVAWKTTIWSNGKDPVNGVELSFNAFYEWDHDRWIPTFSENYPLSLRLYLGEDKFFPNIWKRTPEDSKIYLEWKKQVEELRKIFGL